LFLFTLMAWNIISFRIIAAMQHPPETESRLDDAAGAGNFDLLKPIIAEGQSEIRDLNSLLYTIVLSKHTEIAAYH
jgi:hypothetical protein